LTLRVLYIHPIGAFGGASRSLLELLRGFPAGAVEPRIVAARGQAADALESAGFPVVRARGLTQFDCTRYGHYRGLRWLIVLRELWYLPFTLVALRRARRAWESIDLVHVNEVTAIVPALLAKRMFRKPLVVHARSVQQDRGMALRRDLLTRLLRQHVDAVIAIDDTVKASLPLEIRAEVVHNAFTPEPKAHAPAAVEQLEQRLHPGALRIGMVGNLLPLKGVYEFLEAARLCARQGVDADFIVVGSNPRRLSGPKGAILKALGFARDVEADMERFVADHGLGDRVHRLPFTADISAVYRMLDVVCFPSLLDAVGRPVLEAAWFGVPSIAAVERPYPDTFVDGETGLRIAARNPEALAAAIGRLSGDRESVRRMGAAARRLAEANFDARRNAERVLEVYERLAGPAGGDRSGRGRSV
jgi:glycosyltransferase involved in cell wall biosynthesis